MVAIHGRVRPFISRIFCQLVALDITEETSEKLVNVMHDDGLSQRRRLTAFGLDGHRDRTEKQHNDTQHVLDLDEASL